MAERETWILVLDGHAAVGLAAVSVGQAVFANGGRSSIEVGANGLTALVAYWKGVCHASFSTIRKFFRDVLELPLARGYLAKVIGKVSAALAKPYDELLHLLPDEDVVNVDETGHKLNGEAWWTWCFRAELYVLYHIDARRSGDVLMEILGKEYDGVLGCDLFSA